MALDSHLALDQHCPWHGHQRTSRKYVAYSIRACDLSFCRHTLSILQPSGCCQPNLLGNVRLIPLRHCSWDSLGTEGVYSRGSWFVVINRVILACCWFGVDAWYGGQMVKIMIGAIWRECLPLIPFSRFPELGGSEFSPNEEPFPRERSYED